MNQQKIVTFKPRESRVRCFSLAKVFTTFKRVLHEKDFALWHGSKPHRFLSCSRFYEGGKTAMEDKALIDYKSEGVDRSIECESGCNDKNIDLNHLIEEKDRENSSSSEILLSEMKELDGHSQLNAEDSCSPTSNSTNPRGSEDGEKKNLSNEIFEEQVSSLPIPDLEMIKERFAKLLLGEDMSGSGNGVSAALTISNAITNLCATLFGQLWRLEPLAPEKKAMWRREMECLLCTSDHIVELKPTWQSFPDGRKLEVTTTRPRSDLYVNLPALRKLDTMLVEILDSFINQEFNYVEQEVLATDADGSSSFRQALQRLEDKWWLPVPLVPPSGLHENSRKQLQHKRDSTKQILKAAMAINSITLADMKVPCTYLESLPKTARASLGDAIYRYITADSFSPDSVLACLDLSSEHQALEIANRVEASIYIWRKKMNSRPTTSRTTTSISSRFSWEILKDIIVEGDKIETLAERAESLLLSLKQRFPTLPQTALDVSKIQCNKDVGKSILESYSRVLESLASNIVARIDDVLYVDDLTKHSDTIASPLPKVGEIAHKSYSPARCLSPTKGPKSPFINNVMTHFGSTERKKKFVPTLKTFDEVPQSKTFDDVAACEIDMESSDDSIEEDVELSALDRAWIE